MKPIRRTRCSRVCGALGMRTQFDAAVAAGELLELLESLPRGAVEASVRQIRGYTRTGEWPEPIAPFSLAPLPRSAAARQAPQMSDQMDSARERGVRGGAQIGRPALPSCRRVCILCERDPLCPVPSPVRLRTALQVSVGGRESPRGYPCGGEMGSHGPRADFSFFAPFFTLFSWEFGVLAAMLSPCDSLSALLTVPCCTIDHPA